MTSIALTDLAPETQGALEALAARHNRSLEAEIMAILNAAILPLAAEGGAATPAASRASGLGLGSELTAIGREFGITTEFDNLRDKSPIEPARFD